MILHIPEISMYYGTTFVSGKVGGDPFHQLSHTLDLMCLTCLILFRPASEVTQQISIWKIILTNMDVSCKNREIQHMQTV